MSLILTILNKPNPGQEISSAFQIEGTIGRAPDNTWVLVDPERFTSSKHAQIQSSNGEYFITDLSTNGVFINDSPTPLGKGNSVKLNHGDKLRIGQYEISVTIQAGAPLPLGDPDSSPFGKATESETGSPLGDAAVSTEDLGRVNEPSSLGIGGDNPLDPLAILNGSAPSPTTPSSEPGSIDDLGLGGFDSPSPFDTPAPIPEQFSPNGTSGDNASPLQQQFEPPQPAAPAPEAGPSSMIPDDWQFGAPEAAPKPTPAPTAETSPTMPSPPPAPAEEQEQTTEALPSLDDLLTGSPSTTPTPPQPPADISSEAGPAATIPPLDDIFAEPPAAVTPSPATPQTSAPRPQPTPAIGGNVEAMQNLLKGMGLEHLNLTKEEETALALEAGELVRASVEGLVAVLRARASIKSEFRMSMTTIQAKENNPLKFSPTGMDALNHMFAPGSSSYMPAKQAVEEGFNDMEAHLIAVMAGMQTALHTVLKRFDPAMLERDFEQREKDKGFSLASKKAKHWDVYNSHYKEIIASVEDDFHTLFGDEFSRAYEEQVAKLKSTRKTEQ